MVWIDGVSVVGGLIVLLLGADALVKGASALARRLGVSPLMVGLTVVAFGTSAPELVVTTGAALTGRGGIGLGNVIGSNVFNVLFILGLSALVVPLAVHRQLVRLEVPLLIAVSALALVLGMDGYFGRLDGLVLVAGLLAYLAFTVRQGRKEANGEDEAPPSGMAAKLPGQLLLIGAGLALLALGAHWFVNGAEAIAQALGVSDLIIGLTIVAGGTSLPEAAASVVAGLRGQRDIAVGNVVGSNLFNLLGVLGVASLAAPDGIAVPAGALAFDLPVVLAVAVLCLPVFFTDLTISRGEGALLLGYYGAYLTYLVLRATDSRARELFTDVLIFGVVPLTALWLAVSVWRGLRARRSAS